MNEPAGSVRRALARALGVLVLAISFAAGVHLASGDGAQRRAGPPPGPSSARPTPSVGSLRATDAPGSFVGCLKCHEDLDRTLRAGGDPELIFTHGEHFAIPSSDCASCHVRDTHKGDTIARASKKACTRCHGTSVRSTASGACRVCHPPAFQLRPDTHRRGGWDHVESWKDDRASCLLCHTTRSCESCHGLEEIPHPSRYRKVPHVDDAFAAGIAVCERCHARGPSMRARDSCDSCHHREGDGSVSWWTDHARVVDLDGTAACLRCHVKATCAACHLDGTDDYRRDRENYPGPPPDPDTREA